jgi:hemolysin III
LEEELLVENKITIFALNKNRTIMAKITVTPKDPNHDFTNALIHGIGILFGISALPVLAAIAVKTGSISAILGVTVYAFGFLMTFTFSTLYHSVRDVATKKNLRILDHISIYILIAGTYTPFLLMYMPDSFGITLLVVQWSLVVIGIVFKLLYTGKFKIFSTLVYIAMGCLLFVGGKTFFVILPTSALVWLVIGGGLYIFGCIFYLNKKISYHHAIWHLFVLSAAICHYVAVLLALVNS